MDLGKKIKESRKRAGYTGSTLGKRIGICKAAVSKIENNELKNGPTPDVLIRIAKACHDVSILTEFCGACPVRAQIILRQFPELNNIKTDPAVIASRLRKEMVEGAAALDVLTERFSDKDFQQRHDYLEVFEREMEQVIDVKRGIEILEFELVMASVHSCQELKRIYDRQQIKCEAHGHHVCPGAAAA